MGGVVSKVFGRGYRTNEPGSSNVPADADGAPVEAGRQPAATPAAATECASAAKQEGKPEAAAHGKGTADEAKAQQPGSPTKAQAEPTAPTSDAAKPADQQSSKKPTVLDTAKEDVLGVLESVKRNVGAAKEAFFEKPTKSEQSKPPSSPTKTTAGSAEQAEPTKTPEAKTPEAKGGSFLSKLVRTKSEEAKQKAKEDATSKPADGGKKEEGSGAFLPELSKPALETAQGQAEPPKSAGEKEVTAQTPFSVPGTGAAEAEAGKDKVPGALGVGKLNPQELLTVGKAAAEDLKQKSQEASDAAKQAKQAADAALEKAGELKDAALKAASMGKEKVASLAQQAQKSAAGATDTVAKKGEEAVQQAKAEADNISQKSQEAASAAKSKAEELKESAAAVGKDAAAATAAGVEAVKKASQEAVASATDEVASAAEKAKQTLRSEAEKVEPAVKQASESAKERAQEATDALKSGAESMKEKSEQAASAVRETSKSTAESAASAVKAVPELLKDTAQEVHDKGKEKIESLLQQGKRDEPATASSPAEQKSSESASQQAKPPLPEEPRQSETKPLDVAATKQMVYTAIVDVNAAAAGESALSAKTVTMKSGAEVEDGTGELYFDKPAKDGPQESVEPPKAVSQEVLDSAKSEAELLVERVISSVVGASESLKHSADDAAHSEKDRLEKLKEKAQQEFALCQEKAHHLLSDVTSAVSTAASSVAAKSAEIYDATKSKAHDLSEQVTAKASGTAESLKHGMHTLQEHAVELPQLILHPSKSHGPSGEATTGGSVSETPHEQAPLLPADTQQERAGERLSPSPKPEEIESAVVKIQAGVRGYLTRKNLQYRTQQDGETSPTTGNASEAELSAAAVANGSEPSDTEAAATKIQAAFRGYMVRKELKPDNGPGSGAVHREDLVESR